jgi:hypothetical protein
MADRVSEVGEGRREEMYKIKGEVGRRRRRKIVVQRKVRKGELES